MILALTNPYPEIEPDDALAAGAAFAADGTSVNNVLGYPGIFRGALLSGAQQINPEMKLAAAEVLASLATEAPSSSPTPSTPVHLQVADAVRDAAVRAVPPTSTGRRQDCRAVFRRNLTALRANCSTRCPKGEVHSDAWLYEPRKPVLREYEEPELGLREIRIRTEFATPKHGTEMVGYRNEPSAKRPYDPNLDA